jgi:hypothetical protein
VEVEQVNDLQMDLLITLNTKQFIPVDGLRCTNITADDFQILGRINGYTLDDIYGDTFTVRFFISDLERERKVFWAYECELNYAHDALKKKR